MEISEALDRLIAWAWANPFAALVGGVAIGAIVLGKAGGDWAGDNDSGSDGGWGGCDGDSGGDCD